MDKQYKVTTAPVMNVAGKLSYYLTWEQIKYRWMSWERILGDEPQYHVSIRVEIDGWLFSIEHDDREE